MRILLLGGTGLISVGILKALQHRRERDGPIEVVCFNRGKTPARDTSRSLPADVREVHGDRDDVDGLLATFEDKHFDVVIDMICFREEQADATARLCRAVGAKHLLFCSTVCTYGIEIPPTAVIDETFPQNPISTYGKNKVACEQLFADCDDFSTTVIRPSNTYGEGSSLIDNLEPDPPTWSRIAEGLPVIVAGDGLGLWNSTHRDDVGKLFAYAAMREVTFGKAYNATTERIFTWRDYYREAASSLGLPAKLLFLPRDFIVSHDPNRFGLLREITGYHGAYTSAAAKRDVPEFTCDVDFADGAKRTLDVLRSENRLKPAKDDLIDEICAKAESAGFRAVDA